MLYFYAAILTLLNAVWLALNLLGLPGNWLIVLSAVGFYSLEPGAIHWGTLAALGGLALTGEVLEFALGAAGAAKSGGSRGGAVGAIIGALVGGLCGTFVIPIPVVGSIVGACGGAFIGAMVMEVRGGKAVGHAVRIGQSAAAGRLWGTVAKLAVGVAMWVVATVAAFWG